VRGRISAGESLFFSHFPDVFLIGNLIRPFVLITGTVIGLLLLIVGSVGLLYGIADQELPSVLLGGVVGVRKD
jgi:hypothetical protein